MSQSNPIKKLFACLIQTFQAIKRFCFGNDSLKYAHEETQLSTSVTSSDIVLECPLSPSENSTLSAVWPPLPPSCSTRPQNSTPPQFTASFLRYEGCKDHFYEDAAAFNAVSGFAAVSDGVTSNTSRSDLFSDALVRHFVQGEFYLEKPEERKKWWDICVREWGVQTFRLIPSMSPEEQSQRDAGSGATFIGFWIDPNKGGYLYSIGDCYGFWFDGNIHTQTFPESTDFNNSPATVNTLQEQSTEKLTVISFEILPGNMLALCSDALANFLLSQKPWETQPDFWKQMEAMNDSDFGKWSETRKAAGELIDDDYTLLLLRFLPMTLSERVSKVVGIKTDIAGSLPAVDNPNIEIDAPIEIIRNEKSGHPKENDGDSTEDGYAKRHREACVKGLDLINQTITHNN